MYVIITYDVGEKRVAKMCKKLREYLDWTQNSVFEGEITKGKLQECLAELGNIMDESTDSINLYRVENAKHLKKTILGVDRIKIDMFL